MTVACCQLSLQIGEIDANRTLVSDAIREAARHGAEIIVVPELAVSGYVFEGETEARALAEPADGPTVRGWLDLARELGVVIVGGLCELGPDGVLRNSAVLVDRSGLRTVYRKAHLWDREPVCFVPGAEPPPVVDTEFGKLGVMVCYDLQFPEWVRLAAFAGAELLCAPVNWPLYPYPEGERATEVVCVQAAASTNRLFIAACDRAGVERGVDWVGSSVIVDPDGFPLAGPARQGESSILLARCDLLQARVKRLSDNNDVFADRRPELYGPVAISRAPT